MISVEELVKSTEQVEGNALYRLGTVTSLFAIGTAQIRFDGEEVASEKEYSYLASYAPVIGDRVLITQASGTYIILGKVNYNEKPSSSADITKELSYKISSNINDDRNGDHNINYMYVEPSNNRLVVRRKNGAFTQYNPIA
mgnify:CR=1 FL=1